MKIFVLFTFFVALLFGCSSRVGSTISYCNSYQHGGNGEISVQPFVLWDLQGQTLPSSFSNPEVLLKQLQFRGTNSDLDIRILDSNSNQIHYLPFYAYLKSDEPINEIKKKANLPFNDNVVNLLVLVTNKNSDLSILQDEEILEKFPAVVVAKYEGRSLTNVWIAVSSSILTEEERATLSPVSEESNNKRHRINVVHIGLEDDDNGILSKGILYGIDLNICIGSNVKGQEPVATTTTTVSTTTTTVSTTTITVSTTTITVSTTTPTCSSTEVVIVWWTKRNIIILSSSVIGAGSLAIVILSTVSCLRYMASDTSVYTPEMTDQTKGIVFPQTINDVEVAVIEDLEGKTWVAV